MNHGLILKDIYRVIRFKQEVWLKPYIDKNTDLWKDAKNEFKKNFFKLMNNAVFGKMMGNLRNHTNVKLVNTEARRKKLVSEPNYHSCKLFTDCLMAIEMRKTSIFMDKPIPVGRAMLDISKTLMYEFYYDYLKPKYGGKVTLCYMDTDSFILHIETEDYYEDIAPDVNELYDTSGYKDQEKWPFTIELKKKEIGKTKDEMNGKIIIEFIALRAKTHAFKWLEDEYRHTSEQKKAKGAKKCIIKHNLNFELYKRALFNNETIRCTQ